MFIDYLTIMIESGATLADARWALDLTRAALDMTAILGATVTAAP